MGNPPGRFVPGTQVRIPIAEHARRRAVGHLGLAGRRSGLQLRSRQAVHLLLRVRNTGRQARQRLRGRHGGVGLRDAGDAGADAPALTASTAGYLDVWFEYQYADEGQPSIFVVSNSSRLQPAGANGTRGELDTWQNQWAETYRRRRRRKHRCTRRLVNGRSATRPSGGTFYDDKLEIPLDPDAVVYMVINSSDAASDTERLTVRHQIQQHTLRGARRR